MCLLGVMTYFFTSLGQNSFIYFNIADIWQAVPDSWTLTIKQNVWFQRGICPEKFQLDQNGRLAAIIDFDDFNMRNTYMYLENCAT